MITTHGGAARESFSSQPEIRQTGADTFQVTDPTDYGWAKRAIVSGTRPVTRGHARLWVITSIMPVPSRLAGYGRS